MEDADHQRRVQPDAGAGKSADQVRDDRVPDARFRPKGRRIAKPEVRDAEVVPYRRGVARSAARSCAALEVAAQPTPAVRQDAPAPEAPTRLEQMP
jgi:hypothetical protein